MIYSIRKFLLINLLLSVTLITSLAILGNLLLEHRQFHNHLDSQLTEAAFMLEAFLTDVEPKKITNLQNKINKMGEDIRHTKLDQDPERLRTLTTDVDFQVWTDSDKLILQSINAPSYKIQHEKQLGFNNNWSKKKSWRTFSIYIPQQKIYIVTLQRHDYRIELEKSITKDSIMIMLISCPFLGLLIWIIVGRGLETLSFVTKELSQRSNKRLDQLQLENIPEEITPLVNELNSLFTRLESSFECEKRFAANAAHELRTPLAALYTQVQIASQVTDQQKLKDINAKLINGLKECTHIVEQLLSLSKSISSLDPRESTPLDMTKIIQQNLADHGHHALEKNINIELVNHASLSTIYGNSTALTIMMRNLIDNAIRYTDNNGNLKVIVTNYLDPALPKCNHPNNLIIRIIDSGPGLAPELRSRVFERFYRVFGTKRSGSGLGLSIVCQIVKFHNGSISLEEHNYFPTGLEARITLPLPALQNKKAHKTKDKK
jgi:two-component system, OmpR family, sensor histidine kinase QseC